MRTPSIHKILNGIYDLRNTYISRYGPVYQWNEDLSDIFHANCDVNIKHILEKYEIYPDDKTIKYGLSRGILELTTLKEVECQEIYGCDMDVLECDQKQEQYAELEELVMTFFVMGVSYVY